MDNSKGNPLDWLKVSLLFAVLLLVLFYVILMRHYNEMAQAHALLLKEKKQRQNFGMQEIADWEGELKAWPMLEDALFWMKMADYDKALVSLNKTIKLSKDLELAYYLRAQVYFQSQQDQEAFDDVCIYIEKVPTSIRGLLLRAKLYMRNENLKGAKLDLKFILEQRPDFLEAKTMFATLDHVSLED